jgi:hypothetical protein
MPEGVCDANGSPQQQTDVCSVILCVSHQLQGYSPEGSDTYERQHRIWRPIDGVQIDVVWLDGSSIDRVILVA